MDIRVKTKLIDGQIVLIIKEYEWSCKMVLPTNMHNITKWEQINNKIKNSSL